MQRYDDGRIARGSVLLASVPEDVAETILSRSEIRNYDRGATIFLQGEPADHVFIVLEGWVKALQSVSKWCRSGGWRLYQGAEFRRGRRVPK